jgi:hypothetical protein
MKLLGITNVAFNVTDLLITSTFARYWKKKWWYKETVHQTSPFLWVYELSLRLSNSNSNSFTASRTLQICTAHATLAQVPRLTEIKVKVTVVLRSMLSQTVAGLLV